MSIPVLSKILEAIWERISGIYYYLNVEFRRMYRSTKVYYYLYENPLRACLGLAQSILQIHTTKFSGKEKSIENH